MEYKDARERIIAAQELLTKPSVSRSSFESIRAFLKGFHPRLDKALSSCSKALTDLERLQKGEVIELAADALPEDTKENKKRKKALLLFISSWKNLRAEVERVESELKHRHERGDTSFRQNVTTLGRIMGLAKGPLGIITVIAVALVILNSVAVAIVIQNNGCEPIQPLVYMPIPIPGLSLPQDPIPDGGQGTVKLPPLKFLVDGTDENSIQLTALGYSLNFRLANRGINLLLNGSSLIGQRTTVWLGERPQHELIVVCR